MVYGIKCARKVNEDKSIDVALVIHGSEIITSIAREAANTIACSIPYRLVSN